MTSTRTKLFASIATAVVASATAALADPPAQAPAPIGVFGADMPAKGKLVVSLLASASRMQDSHIGVQTVSEPYIVTHVISPDTPVGTHLLRLAPHNLTVETENLAVAYGLNSDVTLFASTGLVQKDVDMQAFKGLSGTAGLGYSDGATRGLGDTTVAAIWRAHHDAVTRLNVNFGLSLPTGSTTENLDLLLPNDTRPEKRGFYAMQPGTGTVDLTPGVTYSGVMRAWSWGASYRARLPLDRNANDWAYGDLHEANAWVGYTWAPGLETTLRLNASTQGRIDGADPVIKGYAQGANPAFYGGQQAGLYAGAIVGGKFFHAPAAQVGIEAGAPFYQTLNGPQLGRNWQVSLAVKYKL